MRRFMRLDFGEALDAAAPLNFRYLLDEQGLQKKIFEGVNKLPEEKGKIMRGRTIIEALASAKNGAKSRDSDMYRSKKGKERHFRMRAHIEVDAGSGMVLGVSGTAVNVNSIEDAGKLIREDGEFVNADAGYRGIEKREEIKNDEHVSNKGGVANKQT
jgi:IS5 family transposase